jgi:gluconate kinase
MSRRDEEGMPMTDNERALWIQKNMEGFGL